MTTTSGGLSRRTVVKGAAWSVPIVAVAGATPAMAASPKPLEFSGTGCKDPSGGKGARYFFVLQTDGSIPSSTQIPFTVTFSDSTVFTHVDQRPGTFNANHIVVGDSNTITLKFNNPNNAANGLVTIKYTYDGVEYTITNDQYSASCGNRQPPIDAW